MAAYTRPVCIHASALNREPLMTPSRRVNVSDVATAPAGVVQAQAPSMPAPSNWVGSWTLGLRTSPDAASFVKKLAIAADAGGPLEGHVCDGRRIQAGRQERSGGLEAHCAFVTDPGKGRVSDRWSPSVARPTGWHHAVDPRGRLLNREASSDVAP